jgi:hypothetical protein
MSNEAVKTDLMAEMTSWEELDSRPLPFKGGDWVESKEGVLQVGIVKRCYWSRGWNGQPDEILIDLYLYDYDENRVGRVSPVMGGPRTFEPSLSAGDWKRIEKPRFPITIQGIPSEDGTRVRFGYATKAKVLPDRQYIKKKRKIAAFVTPAVQVPNPNGFNLEAEILGKRLAAEKLRDTAHKLFKDNPDVRATMIAEAEKLEREAEALARNA